MYPYADEGKAYKFMWDNSFDKDGNVTHEVAALITNKGILVLPWEGTTYDGRDFKNTPRTSESAVFETALNR